MMDGTEIIAGAEPRKKFLKAEIWRTSSSGGGDRDEFASTQVLGKSIWEDEWVEPPVEFDELSRLLTENSAHWGCCKRKALDTVGLGWEIVPVEGVESPNDDERVELTNFFKKPNKRQSFFAFAKTAAIDFESLGNCAIEIATEEKQHRNYQPGDDYYESKKPVALYRAPMRTIQIRRDEDLYKQEEGIDKAYFRPFGTSPDEKPEYIQDGRAIHQMQLLKDDSTIDDVYGVPDIISAVLAIKAAVRVDWWNYTFFRRNLVPEMVIMVKETGDQAVEQEDLDATKETIEQYMRFEMMGEDHGTLYIQQPLGIEITLDTIAAEVKEASWRGWRLELQDSILTAHQMPPHRLGIVRSGKTTEGALAQMEIYKRSVIETRQQMWEEFFNKLIQEGFGYTDWQFKFEEIDTRDMEAETGVAKGLAEAGLTMRSIYEYLEYEAPDGDDPLVDLPMNSMEVIVAAWANGTLPGEAVHELISTGRFMDFVKPVAGGAMGAEAAPIGEFPTVEDYISGRSFPSGPEEEIRQAYEKKLIDEYGFSKEQILVEVPIRFGSQVKGMADIVIYKTAKKRDPWVVIEIATDMTQEEMDQAASYANALDAEFIVVYDGKQEAVMEKVNGAWQEGGMPKPGGMRRVSSRVQSILGGYGDNGGHGSTGDHGLLVGAERGRI